MKKDARKITLEDIIHHQRNHLEDKLGYGMCARKFIKIKGGWAEFESTGEFLTDEEMKMKKKANEWMYCNIHKTKEK
jgi:hypothetical protein